MALAFASASYRWVERPFLRRKDRRAYVPTRYSRRMSYAERPPLTVYGAPWCPHCKRVKRFLAAHRVPYQLVDIDQQPEAIDRLKELQDGGQIIPTVVYADESFEVNPSDEALAARVGIALEAERLAYDLVIVGGGPAGLPPRSTPPARGSTRSWSTRARSAGRPESATVSTTTRDFPTASPGAELTERFVAQARRYGVELLGGRVGDRDRPRR